VKNIICRGCHRTLASKLDMVNIIVVEQLANGEIKTYDKGDQHLHLKGFNWAVKIGGAEGGNAYIRLEKLARREEQRAERMFSMSPGSCEGLRLVYPGRRHIVRALSDPVLRYLINSQGCYIQLFVCPSARTNRAILHHNGLQTVLDTTFQWSNFKSARG